MISTNFHSGHQPKVDAVWDINNSGSISLEFSPTMKNVFILISAFLHQTSLYHDLICYNFVIIVSSVPIRSSCESINISTNNFRGTEVSGSPRVKNDGLMAGYNYEHRHNSIVKQPED